ncbi:hypothetical protein ABZ436_31115 [Micromonospora matsumotoense]|uniref:hypothetical protein n=1 Tax=Micromonospora matsumotoense TaxID=121616 RepID=UPI0033C046B3
MQIRTEYQAAPVADPVEAKVAIMRPILASVLQSLNAEVIRAFGYASENQPRGALPLHILGRLRAEGDGDVGIAFEYAIHDAVLTRRPDVLERVTDALKLCRIRKGEAESIFFAIEKSGSEQVINTRMDLITETSLVLSGARGRPIKLKRHLGGLASAFRRPKTRPSLPHSIRGLWKADLFLGSPSPDHWVGTTVKSNPTQLESANGLRIGIVPVRAGRTDAVKLDEQRNLIICPVLHDGGYMQCFYETWRIAQVLMKNDFRTPREVDLPGPEDREVARIFAERRLFTVADVLEATEVFAQPHLLRTNQIEVSQDSLGRGSQPETSTLVAPYSMPL